MIHRSSAALLQPVIYRNNRQSHPFSKIKTCTHETEICQNIATHYDSVLEYALETCRLGPIIIIE